MVDKIYEIKNKVLEKVDQEMREKGADRIDPEMVDMIKDLAEAEKSCWEAEYYRAVTEAMEGEGGSGYGGYSGGSSSGGSSSGGRSGWQNQYGSGRNSGGRRGYDGSSRMMGYQEAMDTMRHYMHNSDPVERERMRGEMMSM